MSSNGQYRPQPRVSFDDPAIIARLATCAFLHGEPEALEAIEEHRPDLDPDTLRLSVEIAALVFAELLQLASRPRYLPTTGKRP
jgi:hypothetical protein